MCTRISSVKLCHHEATSHQIPKRTSLPRFGCARWHHVRVSCQPTNDNFACSPVQHKCLFLCAGPLERCLTTNVAPCMIVQPGVVMKTLMLHIKPASCRSLSSSIRAFSCADILFANARWQRVKHKPFSPQACKSVVVEILLELLSVL